MESLYVGKENWREEDPLVALPLKPLSNSMSTTRWAASRSSKRNSQLYRSDSGCPQSPIEMWHRSVRVRRNVFSLRWVTGASIVSCKRVKTRLNKLAEMLKPVKKQCNTHTIHTTAECYHCTSLINQTSHPLQIILRAWSTSLCRSTEWAKASKHQQIQSNHMFVPLLRTLQQQITFLQSDAIINLFSRAHFTLD